MTSVTGYSESRLVDLLDYTDLNGALVVARYRVSGSDPNVADPSSARILLTIDHPAVDTRHHIKEPDGQ